MPGRRLPQRRLGAGELAELARRAGGAEDRNPAWCAREVGTPASLASKAASALVAAQRPFRRLCTFGVGHLDENDSAQQLNLRGVRGYGRRSLRLRSSLLARRRNSLFVRA
jgi:hypothetical protein